MPEEKARRLVVLESPYAGDVGGNLKYAYACMRDSLLRGEAPFASHLLYTQMLDDAVPAERDMGIEAGLSWGWAAEASVVYVDLGITTGMHRGIMAAKILGRRVEYRYIL